MMSLRRPGMGSRPSERCGATEAKRNCARRARLRFAPGRRRSPQPSGGFLRPNQWAERPPVTDDAPKHPKLPRQPRAAIRPSRLSAHGVTWDDDYAWIRAENWRDVLRDPSRLPSDIRAHLEAENAYADAVLAPTAALQGELVREMRARLKEDD